MDGVAKTCRRYHVIQQTNTHEPTTPERREMVIRISPSGAEVTINVKCVQGHACVDMSSAIERALGGEVTVRDLTSDYYKEHPDEGVCGD